MKVQVQIGKSVDAFIVDCSSVKVDNNMFIITDPIMNETKSAEIWIPMSSISFINIIEK